MAFQQWGNTWFTYWMSINYKGNFCHVTKCHTSQFVNLGPSVTSEFPQCSHEHEIWHSIYPKPYTTYHIIIIIVVAAKHCRNLAPKYSHFELMKCMWFLTLFLIPLGLSRSQDEVRMQWSDGEKGEFLPVWRASSRVLFPWRGGPTNISFINLQASAQRNSARRNASTAAGPDARAHTHTHS